MNLKIISLFVCIFLFTSVIPGMGYNIIVQDIQYDTDVGSGSYSGSGSDWPMFRYDTNNSGFSPELEISKSFFIKSKSNSFNQRFTEDLVILYFNSKYLGH